MGRASSGRREKKPPARRVPIVKYGGVLAHHPSASIFQAAARERGKRHLASPNSPLHRRRGTGERHHRDRWPLRRLTRPRPPHASSRRSTVARRKEEEEQRKSLRPLQASEGSIYAGLFRELGGLIRWYADACGGDEDDIIQNVKNMYTQSGCSVEGTKELILHELAGQVSGVMEEDTKTEWIELSMVVDGTEELEGYEQSYDGGGVCLPTEDRAGDGPAHSHETWTNVIVPSWAVGKNYYFTVHNKSPLDLSCEMSIDSHAQKAAKNVPIPAGAKRTIKPEARYYGRHKWVFSHAERVKLSQSVGGNGTECNRKQKSLVKHRYNGVRPKDLIRRVDYTNFPDPSSPPYSWKFTGSNEASGVEFFEKQMNLGKVMMDFYYTTGTVKTTLDHPHNGVNDLFRLCAVDTKKFKEIMLNPRAHTSIGYRSSEQRAALENPLADEQAGDTSVDAAMTIDPPSSSANDNAPQAPIFWAKNDKYDFLKQGHDNRKEAMERLRPTGEFRAWEEAQKKEYACVHAKFFVSLAQRRRGRQVSRQTKPDESTDALPDMAPVVDTKASERALLATEFRSEQIGGSIPASSRVRMERIFGINDRPGWGTGPVFEQKLYYRMQDDENDLDFDKDVIFKDEDSPNPSVRDEHLRESTPLNVYKEEKLRQLDKWHDELNLTDKRKKSEMRSILTSCKEGIHAAQTPELVDYHVKHFWDQNQKYQWQK